MPDSYVDGLKRWLCVRSTSLRWESSQNGDYVASPAAVAQGERRQGRLPTVRVVDLRRLRKSSSVTREDSHANRKSSPTASTSTRAWLPVQNLCRAISESVLRAISWSKGWNSQTIGRGESAERERNLYSVQLREITVVATCRSDLAFSRRGLWSLHGFQTGIGKRSVTFSS